MHAWPIGNAGVESIPCAQRRTSSSLVSKLDSIDVIDLDSTARGPRRKYSRNFANPSECDPEQKTDGVGSVPEDRVPNRWWRAKRSRALQAVPEHFAGGPGRGVPRRPKIQKKTNLATV